MARIRRSGISYTVVSVFGARMPGDPLIEFLRKPTRRRFARLVRATRGQVLDTAYRVTGDQNLAEDVTQEVYVKLLTVKWDPEKIRSGIGLLLSTTVLASLMRVRADDRRMVREAESAARRQVAPATSIDDILDLREAILELPEALQACVHLRYYGGLSSEEVAATLGFSTSAVKDRLARARELLRKRLRPSAWLLLPALAGRADAAFQSIEPSVGLRKSLAQLCRDGPSMAAIAACGATAAGPKPILVACALLAVLASGSLAVWRGGLSPESNEHQVRREAATQHPTDRQGSREPPVERKTVIVSLKGNGQSWPPATVPVKVSGEGLEQRFSRPATSQASL